MEKRRLDSLKYLILFMTYLFTQDGRGSSLDCNFDDDLCAWSQETSDDFNWTRENWGTSSSSTGPSSDHTTGDFNGYFIYIEANSPREKGDKARLNSPMQEPGSHCFMFWYNMYGNGIGTLNVYIVPNATVIFTRSGNIGDRKWKNAVVPYSAPANHMIVIEGIRGDNKRGDIAVDDVAMTSGQCISCTFDSGLCLWEQADTDDFDWKWKKGPTPTYNTGPPADHTSGNGYYIYTETTGAGQNEKARIFTPFQKEGKYCFSLWYYLYGEHIGTLRVFTKDENEKTTEILNISGHQGEEWIYRTDFVHSVVRFRIVIEGMVIDDYPRNRGDIAIDDIVMLSCQDCDNPTPRHGKSNSTNYQHGSALEITCNTGYILRGNSTIVCQSEGTWTARPTCEPVECAPNPVPEHGTANFTNFHYGTVIEVKCNTGYNLTGISVISCQADGTWTDLPTCNYIDCGTKTITHGNFTASSGTTYGNTATQNCKAGYELTGDAVVTCTVFGWNGSAATCIIIGSEGSSAVIAVYVIIPVVVIVLLIALFFFLWRLKVSRCLTSPDTSPKHKKKEQPVPGSKFSNVTYSYHHSIEGSSPDGTVSQDADYYNTTYENSAHYNSIAEENIDNYSYDHTNSSAMMDHDNTYSHVSRDSGLESYNLTSESTGRNAALGNESKDINRNYDVLNSNSKVSVQNTATKLQQNMPVGEDSDYDHTKTGVTIPVDLDDYSHVVDAAILDEDKSVKEKQNDKANGAQEPEYEAAVEETPQYYNLEPQIEDTMDDGREYFVLEKEN